MKIKILVTILVDNGYLVV